MDQYPACTLFLSVLSPFLTQLIMKVSCKCIPGARLNQSIACVGNKKASGRFRGILRGVGLASGSIRQRRAVACADISLRDIQNMPTRSKSVFFQGFLNFLSKAPKFHSVGGGMCMLFEICEKRPFQKCMGWGGIGDHIFEYRGRPFRRFRVFRPQAAPLMRAGHQLTGLPLGAPTYCGVGAKWKEVNGCILTC